ncbi:MAG: serine/threonine protein kinase, partial [Victivallales bacterium]|nr:serine/threonine protein kinase [Victivallales bacterium]
MSEDVQCGHCDEIVSVPNARLATGAVIGDFALLEELGRGGMGVVYLAHQISLDRPAALKILQDSYANNAEFVVNFIKEARSSAKLNHPHIVQAYAVGEDEGIFYYAMEYINGDTMKDVLKRDKIIPIDKAVTIIQQIAEALDCAWKEQKLIHRDIKPDNIILAKNNRAKLADLGLSKVAGDIDDEDDDEIMGTPQYISPEHLTGAPMDVRSDIYSLGATFYQFVTGRFPFEGRTANEIARKHLEATLVAPQLVNSEVPEAIGQIIMKMMKKNVSERYQDAEELVEDLRLFRRGKLSSTKPVPKVFSTKSGNLPRVKDATVDDKSQPIDMNFNTTTTGNLKPLYAGATTSTDSKLIFLDETDTTLKKPRKKLIIYSSLMIAFIVLAGAALMWFFILPIGDDIVAVQSPVIPLPMPIQRTFRQEYLNAVNQIMADYKTKKCSKMEFLTKSDAVFKEFPRLLAGKERKKHESLLKIYVPLDETKRVIPVRAQLRKKHLTDIAAYKKKIRMLRIQEAKAIKAAELRRIRLEKEALERERRLAIKQNEDRLKQIEVKKRVENYKKTIAKRKDMLIYNFFAFAELKKYTDAEKMFADAIREPGRVRNLTTTERNLAKALSSYAQHLKKAFQKGREVNRYLTTNNDKLIGLGIEFARYKYGHIRRIKDGVIYFKMGNGSIVKQKLSDFSKKHLYK